jgi:hypothetical protein
VKIKSKLKSKLLLKLESDESEANRRPSLLANVMGCFGGSGSKNDAEEDKRRKEANKRIEKQIQKDKQIYRATHRLLLLGLNHKFFIISLKFIFI